MQSKKIMTFKELKISEHILKALLKKKYEKPTLIQEQSIPIILKNIDLIGIAQTGAGKTAAFAIPIIQQLNESLSKVGKREIKTLIITPTRELAIQIDDCFREYAEFTSLRHTVIFGGVKQNAQVNELKRGTDILIATPGRLLDLINQKYISLKGIKYFVLDEADRMLDMGFIHDIKKIPPLLPKSKQTMLFSATMPKMIADLSKSILHNPVQVEVTPISSVVDTIKQCLYYVEKDQKNELLINILKKNSDKLILVFSRTKHRADKITCLLNKAGILCKAIHGNKTQSARQQALADFKSGKIHVIVATDIAARGIDINNLEIVINYDLSDIAETYVHRIGRAGYTGTAITFCSKEEHFMVKDIQKMTGKELNIMLLSA
jgi:ATP-dependent RNA helicase RhlE